MSWPMAVVISSMCFSGALMIWAVCWAAVKIAKISKDGN